jgi:small subunit ribosomal protein S2
MAKMPTLREMLNAGVHFGHKTSRWHPKMDEYVFMAKNGVHVINLEKTAVELEKATEFLKNLANEGKTIVFVGTKKQASAIVKKAAVSCGMPYVDFRWVGGTLTNFETIKDAVSNFVKRKEELANAEDKLSKKELSKLRDKIEKGEKLFGGIVGLSKKPDAFILIGAHDEKNALAEANIESIPIVALVDTNSDPTLVTYPVPANDDATKSIELFTNLFAQVIKENKAVAKVNENNQETRDKIQTNSK